MINQQILFVGMPESGKTSFLAALWHLIEAREVPCALHGIRLPDDCSYLNGLRDRWLSCVDVGRTSQGAERQVYLELASEDGNQQVKLCIPDLSGETYEAQWATRVCSTEYQTLCGEATGAIVFIHPFGVTPSVPLSDVAPDQSEPSLTTRPWSPEFTSTQVKLVEVLQFLLALAPARPLRLSIAISAWDLVEEASKALAPETPTSWLKTRLPLLEQFLRANSEDLIFRLFGVSAIGGQLHDEMARQALAEQLTPAERIRVIDASGQPLLSPHDLTCVVHWLLR